MSEASPRHIQIYARDPHVQAALTEGGPDGGHGGVVDKVRSGAEATIDGLRWEFVPIRSRASLDLHRD